MPHMTTPTPTSERIRVTVPVTPEVLQAFQTLAKASGMSTGRAMGEWLLDTLDGVQFMAATMEKARAAPRLVAHELHAYAMGITDETGALLASIREQGRQAGAPGASSLRSAAGPGEAAASPRPVIRGGKSSTTGKGKSV